MARHEADIDPFTIHLRRLQFRFRRRLGVCGNPPHFSMVPMRGWATRAQEFGRIVDLAPATAGLRSAIETNYGHNLGPR